MKIESDMSGVSGPVNTTVAAVGGADDPDVVMQETRQRFSDRFQVECDGLASQAGAVESDAAARDAVAARCHSIAGLAGTIGYPAVSRAAAALEDQARQGTFTAADLTRGVEALRAAFAAESASEPPAVEMSMPQTLSLTVLLAEDDALQRTITAAALRRAGHQVINAASGEEALTLVRTQRPDVILLDVEMPGLGGYATCRELKSQPDLADIPVAFLSAHTGVDERLTGLSNGAEDFLTKPVDPRELALRVQLLGRSSFRASRTPPDVLTYEAFVEAANMELTRGRVALALIRTTPGRAGEIAAIARDEVRRRDLCGHYDRNHVAVLLPDVSATTARQRIGAVVARCSDLGFTGVHAGITSADAGTRSLPELFEEADEALAVARYQNIAAAIRTEQAAEPVAKDTPSPLVLVADDDPDVIRILDAHLGGGGYRRALAFDGATAIEESRAQQPDVLILDLMMPRRTGFDVLTDLANAPRRPRTIVLSARGREDDVVRAFALGADDFMTKPFNPQELLARVARLAK